MRLCQVKGRKGNRMTAKEKRPGRPRGREKVPVRDAEQRLREIRELYASMQKPEDERRPAMQRNGLRRN